jgi:hypothetical protein
MDGEASTMADFVRGESLALATDQQFTNWCTAVSKGVGLQVDPNGIAWDLYSDGCTVKDAISEISGLPLDERKEEFVC